MTTPTLFLILWSVFCLGLSLAIEPKPSLNDLASNLGIGMVLWSVGVGVWMVVGFVVRAL